MKEVEDIKLTEFRQLKKEIRGSKDHLIVGIDIAKEKHLFERFSFSSISFPSSAFSHLPQRVQGSCFHLLSSIFFSRQAYRGNAFKKWSKSYPIKIVPFLKMNFSLLTG